MIFTHEFDREILHYAFRYALGRRSYSTGIVIDEIRRNWKDMKQFDRDLIKKEIRAAINDWNEIPPIRGIPFMPADIVREWEEVLRFEDVSE